MDPLPYALNNRIRHELQQQKNIINELMQTQEQIFNWKEDKTLITISTSTKHFFDFFIDFRVLLIFGLS